MNFVTSIALSRDYFRRNCKEVNEENDDINIDNFIEKIFKLYSKYTGCLI